MNVCVLPSQRRVEWGLYRVRKVRKRKLQSYRREKMEKIKKD